MQLVGVLLVLVALAIVGLIVLRVVVSIALSLFWPLLLIALGVGIGLWWASRRTGARKPMR